MTDSLGKKSYKKKSDPDAVKTVKKTATFDTRYPKTENWLKPNVTAVPNKVTKSMRRAKKRLEGRIAGYDAVPAGVRGSFRKPGSNK
jgi:hypothetical protein